MKIIFESIKNFTVQVEFTPKELKKFINAVKVEYFEILPDDKSHEEFQKGWVCICINHLSVPIDKISLETLENNCKLNNFELYYQTYVYGFGETKEEAFKELLERTKNEEKKYEDNLDLLKIMRMTSEHDKIFKIIKEQIL